MKWITESGLTAYCIDGPFSKCGYVEVPQGHPLYGKGYSEPLPELKTAWQSVKEGPIGKRGVISVLCATSRSDDENCSMELIFDVHGGVTYCGNTIRGIDTDGWLIGFDCHHCDDTPEVCNEAYVKGECEGLARQICGIFEAK